MSELKGILLVNKPKGPTSFDIVAKLRKILRVEKIGHAGTLDPMATGLLVLLIGRDYTRLSDHYLATEKAYTATLTLGYSTDSYDAEGIVVAESAKVPTQEEVDLAIAHFQGGYLQTPPMFSAKKIGGKKLCDLARKGITLERQASPVSLHLQSIHYLYPTLSFSVICSKGTYIRSLAEDIGRHLGCFATLTSLERTASGNFSLKSAFPGDRLFLATTTSQDILPFINIL